MESFPPKRDMELWGWGEGEFKQWRKVRLPEVQRKRPRTLHPEALA
jgi:hypothetical protein